MRFLVALALAATPLSAQEIKPDLPAGGLTVELNKFEEVDAGCRAYFLFRNTSDTALEAFELSLAVLDSDGIIDRLLTIDAAPLPADRTTLKLFEIPEIGCGRIGEVLLHEIAACTPQNGAPADCLDFIALASRTEAELYK